MFWTMWLKRGEEKKLLCDEKIRFFVAILLIYIKMCICVSQKLLSLLNFGNHISSTFGIVKIRIWIGFVFLNVNIIIFYLVQSSSFTIIYIFICSWTSESFAVSLLIYTHLIWINDMEGLCNRFLKHG